LGIGKVSGALQQPDFPIFQLGAFAIFFFCFPAFLSMQKIAVLNATRMAALAATGKVVSFF
jgi:hypothetical protein